MKKYLLIYFCCLVSGIINSMGPIIDDEIDQRDTPLEEFIKELERKNFESQTLQLLCIEHILLHPREYIKHNAEYALTLDIQDTIRDVAYNGEIRKKLLQEHYPLSISTPYKHYSQDGFLSDRICLAQVLLLKACTIAQFSGEKIILTQKEQEIFSGMLPQQYEEVKPHIKKPLWAELYDIFCT